VTRFAQRQADAAHAGAASTLPALETDAVALCDSWVARLEDTGARLPELLPLSRAVEHYAGKLRAIEQGKPSATNRRAAEAHADQLGRARAKYEQAVRDYACGELVVTDDIDQVRSPAAAGESTEPPPLPGGARRARAACGRSWEGSWRWCGTSRSDGPA
jgi:hypothetical protein